MIEFKFVPKKKQKFEIGRTINFTRCSKECGQSMGSCDFLHCPIKNYAPIMERYRYTAKEFYESTKNEKDYYTKEGLLNTEEAIEDFLDACISFPRGNYWLLEKGLLYGYEIRIGKVAPKSYSKFTGEDFVWGAQVAIFKDNRYTPYIYGDTTILQSRASSKNREGIKK